MLSAVAAAAGVEQRAAAQQLGALLLREPLLALLDDEVHLDERARPRVHQVEHLRLRQPERLHRAHELGDRLARLRGAAALLGSGTSRAGRGT